MPACAGMTVQGRIHEKVKCSNAAGIIEYCGGAISVESAEGEGTTFSIRLPRGGA